MTIEAEIKQSRFANESEKLLVNVLFTGNWVYHQNALRLKKYGLTPEQFNVLRILRGSYPSQLKLTDITCRMLDKSSNATRLVEKLRLKGLVTRETCANNRRQVDICITPEGLKLLSTIDLAQSEWNSVVAHLTTDETTQLNQLLDKLRSTTPTS